MKPENMRLLYEMDKKNYDPNGTRFSRPSVRGIIFRDGKVAMMHSEKYDYYKFPGGGMERGESQIQTLIREVREETGLTVIPSTIQAYGYVHRVEKGYPEDIFEQDNFYYLCEVAAERGEPVPEAYEIEERFSLVYAAPEQAIGANRAQSHPEMDWRRKNQGMLEREALVLECLMKDPAIHTMQTLLK